VKLSKRDTLHGARPGVKDGQNTQARAQMLGIGRELL